MKIWIVIPAYNEASVIRRVVVDVKQKYPSVVVVDDRSKDSTASEAEAGGAKVLQHIINRGQGAALKTGIVYALRQGADIIVTFDADGQHRVEDIAAMVAPIEQGVVEVTLGSRFLNSSSNVPPLRKLILQVGIVFTRFFSRINVTDTHNGFRAFSRLAAEKIRIVQDRMAHASEILDEITRHQLRYQEIPVTITYSYYSRGKGQSSWSMFKIAAKYMMHKISH